MGFQISQKIGSYTLLSKLGKGGFGEVWLAEKSSQFVKKKVAIKLPLDEQVDFKAIEQEATLWEQASGHPNVLPIIDADIEDGQVIIVSEYADGGSLADKIKREGKLPIKQVVEMTVGILSGLEFLHNRKIIHRDIKPANILLQQGIPRLTDFGISRAMKTTIASSTIAGTDAYMSPESFKGVRTVQTDIWSVGVVLYQLLNGSLPFPQENPSERMYSILHENFAPLSKDVSFDLRRIVEKSLNKLPENRYQRASEMYADLQTFMNGTSMSVGLRNPSSKILRFGNVSSAKMIVSTSEETRTVVQSKTRKLNPPQNQEYKSSFRAYTMLVLLAVSILAIQIGVSVFSEKSGLIEAEKVVDTYKANTNFSITSGVNSYKTGKEIAPNSATNSNTATWPAERLVERMKKITK